MYQVLNSDHLLQVPCKAGLNHTPAAACKFPATYLHIAFICMVMVR